MQIDPTEARLRVARMFLRARQPLGAAVVLAELARRGNRDPEVWCGLGAALLGSRGALVVKPFELWAARVLREAEPLVFGTPFAQTRLELERGLPPPATAEPMDAVALDELIPYLLVTDDVLPGAIDGLPADDRMFAVMMLADHSGHALPVIRAAIRGRWGPPAARAALKRCGRFLDRVDLRAAITAAGGSPGHDELEPYLGHVLDQIRAHDAERG